MKRFNIKLFAYLMGGLVLTGAGLFLLHYFQSGRIADALLWQARHAEEKGDLNTTAQYLRRYLEFEPGDLEERAHLGLTLANPKLVLTPRSRLNALYVLERVLNQQPQRHELRRPLVRVAIEMGQLDLARDHLNILEQKFPQDGEVQFLRAQWHEAKTEYKEAQACYQKAIRLEPKKTDYRVRLALLLRQQLNQEGDALKVAREALAVDTRDAAALLMAASLIQNRPKLTTDDTQKDLAEARELIRKGRKLYPQDANFIKAEAGWYIRKEQAAEAIACLEEGLRKLPADIHADIFWTLANLYLDQKEVQQGNPQAVKKTQEAIEHIRQDKVLSEAVEFLDARLLICRGEWARAARQLEHVRPRLERSAPLTTQIDLYLGQCYEHLEDPTRRLAAYKRAVAREEWSVPALLGLAGAEWALGKMDQAALGFQKAVPLGLPEKGWVEYGRFLIERNRQSENQDWPGVLKILDQARAGFPDSADVAVLRAEVFSAQNQFLSAEKALTEARQKHPEKIELWTAAIALAESEGELPHAFDLLAQARKKFGDKAALRLEEARLGIHQKGALATKVLLILEEDSDKFSNEDKDTLFRGLADGYYKIGDAKMAAEILTQAAALPSNRKDLRLRLRLFDLCLENEDEPALLQVLDQVRALEGDQGAWWRYGRASYLIWKAKRDPAHKPALLAEARHLLEAVALQRSSWSPVLLAQAEIEDLLGNATRAKEYYGAALKQGENDKRIIHHLIRRSQALVARGERSVEIEKKLRQAVDLAPTVSEGWLSLVKYLAVTNQKKAAAEAIDKFARLLVNTNWVEGRLALGECYEVIGDLKIARQTYEALLDSQRTVQVIRGVAGFYMRAGLPADAKPLLETLLKPENKLPAADVAWARRALAMVLADGSSDENFRKALELVGLRLDEVTGKVTEEVGSGAAASDEDQRARARVLAATDSRPLRLLAIARLKQLHARGMLQPEDRLLLAKLYDAEGKTSWTAAEDLLTGLVAEFPQNASYVARLAQSLLEHNQPARAEPHVARLARMEKERTVAEGTYGSIVLQARVLELKGEHDRGLALLKKYAEEKPVRLDRIMAYAAYLTRRKQVAQALDLCEQNWQAGPPEVLGGMCVALLRSVPQRRVEDCDRAERLLRASIKAHPKAPVLQLQLADLLDLRGRYQEAEDQYRQVLQPRMDPNNVMALNNLAWLLAERSGPDNRAARIQEARDLIKKAIALRGPRPELLDTRATVRIALGQAEAAIADLERATREEPSASRYFHLARALRLAQKSDLAREAFQKARASGLEPRGLHPTERVAYHQIAEEFEQR